MIWKIGCLEIKLMKRLSIFIYALITVFTLVTSVHAAGSKGNTTIQSFSKAKKILIKKVYRGHQTTFYCESQYTQGKQVIHTNGYVPKRNSKRAHRLEWEHIVPAHAFGQSFKEWREGHPECVNRKGNVRGRKGSKTFSEMRIRL
jgi:deoxyribonuclease-1